MFDEFEEWHMIQVGHDHPSALSSDLPLPHPLLPHPTLPVLQEHYCITIGINEPDGAVESVFKGFGFTGG